MANRISREVCEPGEPNTGSTMAVATKLEITIFLNSPPRMRYAARE
jgi:hypothetical protein